MKKQLIAAITLSVAGMFCHSSFAKPDKHNSGSLPPGLQKKQQSGKPLPPGWQKNLHKGYILDDDIYAHAKVVVPLGRHGTITVDIDGRILKLHETTREILDIIR